MKNIFLKTSSVVLMAGILLVGCKNSDKPDLDNSTTMDNANSQSVFDDALKISEDVLTQNNSARMEAGHPGQAINCATVDSIKVTSDSTTFIVTFNSSCTGYDGKVRSGKLYVSLKGTNFNTPGTKLTIKSVGYTVNGIKVNGKKTVTCVTGGANPSHALVVSDTTTGTDYATITYPDGKVAKWKTHRTRTLVSGGGTAIVGDNVYDISTTSGIGNPAAEGINKEGRHYSVNILSPVRIDFTCLTNNTARYPTQGILELQPDGKVSRSIDYGAGACDNDAKVTIGKYSYDVKLSY